MRYVLVAVVLLVGCGPGEDERRAEKMERPVLSLTAAALRTSTELCRLTLEAAKRKKTPKNMADATKACGNLPEKQRAFEADLERYRALCLKCGASEARCEREVQAFGRGTDDSNATACPAN